MKCVNATWEERNLGVKTIEISIEKKDAALPAGEIYQQIENMREEYKAKYVVVKVDTKYPIISQLLQEKRYILIESQIGLKVYRENALEAYEKYKGLFPGVSYKLAVEDDVDYVLKEINKGIFTTDRIALDPYFGVDVANRRYALWTQDEIQKGADLIFSCYKGQPFGFFLGKSVEKGHGKGLLGGIFISENTKKCGALYLFSSLKCFIDGGGEVSRTMVSSNNVSILQLHLMFGNQVTNITNVLVKHFE